MATEDTVPAEEKANTPTIHLHVILTEDGVPGWIGPEAREGSQEMAWPDDFPEGVTDPILFLAAHRRLRDGAWDLRPPPPPKTAEEVAAEEAELALSRQLQDERDAAAREEEIARRTLPYTLQRAVGEITIAQLKEHRARIRAEVEAGN